jgi:tetratricopeptide (TPR) repeat protein
MVNLANPYALTGNHDKAIGLYQKILEVNKRTLGEHHPYTVSCMMVLATLYNKIDEHLEEARELLERVLEFRRYNRRTSSRYYRSEVPSCVHLLQD